MDNRVTAISPSEQHLVKNTNQERQYPDLGVEQRDPYLMASVLDEAPPTKNDEVEAPPAENEPLDKTEEVEQAPAEQAQSTEPTEDREEPSPPSDSTAVKPDDEEEPQSPSPLSTTANAQEQSNATSVPSAETDKENIDRKPREPELTTSKPRSVNFASKVDDIEVPSSRSTSSTANRSNYSSSKSSRRPVDFIDALVESYKLETSGNTSPNKEEKKYVPKTNRSRLNPNWREHRTRRLMNKLEELSLWDREEEMKATQAQSLRDQKWEQIQDRQRNHDLCLNLMRQRHESEMESAVLLDRGVSGVNDENTSASIARAMNLATPAELLEYDLPTPPHSLKRRVRQDQEKSSDMKTALGRYRQFESNMTNKMEKINQKLQPDREIMRAYSPFRTAIPPTATPLFSETYAHLLAVPDTHSTNKYNQYHYGVASYLHQPQHAPSPDYEARPKSYSNRDVRVPLKEQANDYSYYDDENADEHLYRSNLTDDDYYPKHRSNAHDYQTKYRSNPIEDDYHRKHRFGSVEADYSSKYRSNPIEDDYYSKYRSSLSSKQDYSPPRRTTSLASPTASALYDYTTVANTPRDYSLIHSSQPVSNSIHLRSLNDDLNAITRFSTETSRKILQNVTDSPNNSAAKSRSSSSMSTSKRVSFNDRDVDDDDMPLNYMDSSRNYSSKSIYQPVEIISLSSSR